MRQPVRPVALIERRGQAPATLVLVPIESADRAGRPADTEAELARAMAELLAARSPAASICPSEAARRVGGETWRELMPAAREVAARLAAAGVAEVTQGGEVVDARTARGPIRVRRPRRRVPDPPGLRFL